MKALKYMFDASKAALKAIALVVRAVLELVHAVVSEFLGLFGIRVPDMPKLPLPETTPADLDERLARDYDVAVDADLEHASDLGMTVHRYASARDPQVRGAVDLDGLDAAQLDWLLALPEEHLERLAQAGPHACGRAARGKRCGVVGLPLPETVADVVEEEPDATTEAVRQLLRDGVRARRVLYEAA